MIQYPYSYGDELTDKEARENLEYFISRYGYSLVLILLTAPILSVANDSQIQSLTQSFHSNQGKVTVDHKPTVHTVVANKGLQGSIAGALCVQSGNPVLGVLCGPMFIFSMKK